MPKATLLTPEFTAAYANLNAEQKQAVDTIDGAVMVVAGPGTGKTQTIALRVANILKQTHMRPSNILCLTFSTSGVKAMRDRLRHFIGPDAYGVTVQTIHGFCNEIILQHPDVFANWATLEQVSEIERLRMCRAGLATLPKSAILRRPRVGQDRAMAVLKRIDELKRENMRPVDLQEFVPLYTAEIAFTPTGKERDQTTAAYKNDAVKVGQFKEFIQIYQYYQDQLQATHRYDFSDMILTCLDALKANDWLLAPLQEQYQYVLVDEFQDLNRSQFDVIETLISYIHTQNAPNIFCVGDDDQAIYRFQGANLGNMQAFMARFPAATVITLTQNYRSCQPVLTAAQAVIEYNEGRLVHTLPAITKTLVAAGTVPDALPQLYRYPSPEVQYGGIAEFLKCHHAQGIIWSEMAIICRRNADVLQATEFLTTAGIPCDAKAKKDLTKQTEVLQLISIIRAVVDPADAVLLSEAIAAPIFAVPRVQLAILWTTWRTHTYKNTTGETMLSFILDPAHALQVPAVHQIAQKIWEWHTQLPHKILPEILQDILIATNLVHSSGLDATSPMQLGIVYAFYEYVKTRCYEQKNVDAAQLLADLDQFITEDSLRLQFDVPHLVTDGVQLLTAHAAKGLEYQVVVLPNMWSGNWGDRRMQSDLSLPLHLLFKHDKAKEKALNQEDERRLFFVALTRAKQHIYCTIPEMYRSGETLKEAEVSGFIAEAGAAIKEVHTAADLLPAPIIPLITPVLPIEPAFRAFLQERIEHFELSITALNTFLEDPQKFLWEQLLRQPRAKLAHLAYGTAVHAALEYYALARKNNQDCSVQQIVQTFSQYLQERELMTPLERETYIHMGEKVLTSYATEMLQNQPNVLYTERQLKAYIGDIPLKGNIDRIDLLNPTSNQIRIVDYKTGTPKTEAAVLQDERYFRQLVFYKLLADNAPNFPFTALKFCLDFVGNETAGRRVVELSITEQDTKALAELIKKVWAKIIVLDFTPLED